MSESNEQPPSRSRIAQGTVVAAVVAVIVLVTAVLPAEYGIDPTGIGNAFGFTALNQPVRTPRSHRCSRGQRRDKGS